MWLAVGDVLAGCLARVLPRGWWEQVGEGPAHVARHHMLMYEPVKVIKIKYWDLIVWI